MRTTLRALSALLGYPSAELKEHIGEVRTGLRSEAAIPSQLQDSLEPLLQAFEKKDLIDLQIDYSELFDHSRSLSLHLFEHVHGESRERGQAMIDLGQQYIDRGFIMEPTELPDFLPLFLEFLSCLPPQEAQDWLGEPVHVLAVLAERLSERESPYAAILQVLVALADARPDPDAIAELQERTGAHTEKPIDEEWEEAPVDFTAPLPRNRSDDTTWVIDRIRSASEMPASTGRH
ncbi:nitrate reductase molybdenum cofactor assembly chaperone [Halomonas shantousis]